jgi:hypothetical protein
MSACRRRSSGCESTTSPGWCPSSTRPTISTPTRRSGCPTQVALGRAGGLATRLPDVYSTLAKLLDVPPAGPRPLGGLRGRALRGCWPATSSTPACSRAGHGHLDHRAPDGPPDGPPGGGRWWPSPWRRGWPGEPGFYRREVVADKPEPKTAGPAKKAGPAPTTEAAPPRRPPPRPRRLRPSEPPRGLERHARTGRQETASPGGGNPSNASKNTAPVEGGPAVAGERLVRRRRFLPVPPPPPVPASETVRRSYSSGGETG